MKCWKLIHNVHPFCFFRLLMTSDIYSGFQSQGGSLVYFRCFVTCTQWSSTSGATPARHRTIVSIVIIECKYVDQNSLATKLAVKRSAGVTPDVNLSNPLCTGNEACKQGDLPWLWNPRQTSPEVQNRNISGSTKRTDFLPKIFLKKS